MFADIDQVETLPAVLHRLVHDLVRARPGGRQGGAPDERRSGQTTKDASEFHRRGTVYSKRAMFYYRLDRRKNSPRSAVGAEPARPASATPLLSNSPPIGATGQAGVLRQQHPVECHGGAIRPTRHMGARFFSMLEGTAEPQRPGRNVLAVTTLRADPGDCFRRLCDSFRRPTEADEFVASMAPLGIEPCRTQISLPSFVDPSLELQHMAELEMGVCFVRGEADRSPISMLRFAKVSAFLQGVTILDPDRGCVRQVLQNFAIAAGREIPFAGVRAQLARYTRAASGSRARSGKPFRRATKRLNANQGRQISCARKPRWPSDRKGGGRCEAALNPAVCQRSHRAWSRRWVARIAWRVAGDSVSTLTSRHPVCPCNSAEVLRGRASGGTPTRGRSTRPGDRNRCGRRRTRTRQACDQGCQVSARHPSASALAKGSPASATAENER